MSDTHIERGSSLTRANLHNKWGRKWSQLNSFSRAHPRSFVKWEMNGHEVATKIKRIRPQVPIVMVSSDDAVPEQALDAVDAFVSKDEVARCLLSVLNRICRAGPSSSPVSDRSVA